MKSAFAETKCREIDVRCVGVEYPTSLKVGLIARKPSWSIKSSTVIFFNQERATGRQAKRHSLTEVIEMAHGISGKAWIVSLGPEELLEDDTETDTPAC